MKMLAVISTVNLIGISHLEMTVRGTVDYLKYFRKDGIKYEC